MPPGETSRWRRLVAAIIRSEDPDLIRRSGMPLFIIALGLVTSGLSALVHLEAGDPARAAFTGLYGPALLPTLLVLRATRNPELTSHLLLAAISVGLVVSPFLADDALRIPLGLLVVPMTATAVIGLRGGMIWSSLCALAFIAMAIGLPLEPAERSLTFTATIICCCLGAGEAWFAKGRLEALHDAEAARQRAEQEMNRRAAIERSLRESQRLFATLFRRAPSLLILSEIDGRIIDVNEAFVELSGWSAEEAIGRTLSDLGAWPSSADRDRLRELVARPSPPDTIELQMRDRRGTLLHLLASAEVIDVDGRPQLLAQAIDVTDRKHHEEALAEYRAELEQRVEESSSQLHESMARLADQERLATVGTLAAGIAHQINNPIGAISAIAELALLEAEDAEAAGADHREMRRILAEARRCGRIVKSILQFARDEPSAKWTEDLNPTVQRAGGLSRGYIHSRGGRLKLTLEEAPLPVLMSPIAVEQAVVNLLRNAAEASPDGARVELSTVREADAAVIRVTDDGPGVSDADAGRLIDPFFTTRLEEGGTGLGLSVVHGIVRDHQGRLSIESPEGGGSRFEIRLPIHTITMDPGEARRPRRD